MTNPSATMSSEVHSSSNKSNTAQPSTTLQGVEMAQPIETARSSGSAFASFAKLPAELQMMIWESAAAYIPPRTVLVDVSFENYLALRLADVFGDNLAPTVSVPKFKSRTTLPGLLQSCSTARMIVEKMYGYTETIESSSGGVIRLDGNRDMLLLFNSRLKWEDSDGRNVDHWIELGQEIVLKMSFAPIVFEGIKRLAVYEFGNKRVSNFTESRWWKYVCDRLVSPKFPDLERYWRSAECAPEYDAKLEWLQEEDKKLFFMERPMGTQFASKVKYQEFSLEDEAADGRVSLDNGPL